MSLQTPLELPGTTRFLNEVERQKMPDSIENTAQSTAEAYGCTANVRYEFGVSVTDNYDKNTEFAIEAA
jgi:metal-dependent amidase/aminoacylase/carboxypeptidase family protein